MQIRDGQKLALIKLSQKFVKGRKARLFLISDLIGREIKSTSELSVNEWRKVRDAAYPDWPNDNWEVAENFKHKCRAIAQRYEKEVIGQQVMF